MSWIYEPWPWYVSGPMIALVLLLLLLIGKKFGMSSNLRTLCTMCGADTQADFFKFDWKAQRWNLVVVLGAIIGGYIAANFLSTDTAVLINPETTDQLKTLGFQGGGQEYLPTELFFKFSIHEYKRSSDSSHRWLIGWFRSTLCGWLYFRTCYFRA